MAKAENRSTQVVSRCQLRMVFLSQEAKISGWRDRQPHISFLHQLPLLLSEGLIGAQPSRKGLGIIFEKLEFGIGGIAPFGGLKQGTGLAEHGRNGAGENGCSIAWAEDITKVPTDRAGLKARLNFFKGTTAAFPIEVANPEGNRAHFENWIVLK